MEYYSPEYFLEPMAAITLHKPVLPSITNISYHDIVQISVAPSKQPSHGQMCTTVYCSTSSSATTMNQDSVHIQPSPINTSERCPTSMFSPGIGQQISNKANNTSTTDKPQFIQPEPSVANAHLSTSTPPAPSVVTNTPLSKQVITTKKKLTLKRHVEHIKTTTSSQH